MRPPSPRRRGPRAGLLPLAAAGLLLVGCAETQLHVGATDGRAADCEIDQSCPQAVVLRGRVVDMADDAPVGNASVVVLDGAGLEIAGPDDVSPDGSFEFELDVVPNESISLGASAPAYHTVPSEGHPAPSITFDDDVPALVDDDRTRIRLDHKGNG